MGMDLKPRKRSAEIFCCGGFFWAWMLEAGCGLPLGHGPGVTAGSFIYLERPDGLSVGYNDGALVTAGEAKEMAKIAGWIADYQDALHAEWEKESEADRERMGKNMTGLYNLPVRRDYVAHLRRFAEWAPASGGFRVK